MTSVARCAWLVLAVAEALVALGCGAGASASKDGGTSPRADGSMPAPAVLDAGGAGLDATAPRAPPPCLPRAQRTFIGFSEGMSLDDFELAAIESERAMDLVQRELCARADELEPSGALASELAAGRLELFEVLFVRDDASAADVGLRPLAGLDAGAGGGYRVAVERSADTWRIVSVTRA